MSQDEMGNFRQCEGKSKRTGERCKARAMSKKNVCYHHGGKSLAGVSSGTFKHGRYSKFLPKNLEKSHEAALADETYIELHAEVALLQSRTGEVLESLGRNPGEGAAAWEELEKLWERFQKADESNDTASAGKFLTALGNVIEGNAAKVKTEARAWDEIREIIRDRRSLAETERKRIMELQSSIRSDQALAMVQVLVDTMRRHIRDRKILAAITSDISQFVLSETTEFSAN